jgi:hypothetical protein
MLEARPWSGFQKILIPNPIARDVARRWPVDPAQALMHQIAGSNPSSAVLIAAGRIAEAQIDVVQVRAARRQLIAPGLNDEGTFVWSDLAKQLRALDRYERRALSRRKRASEDRDTIRVLEAAPG